MRAEDYETLVAYSSDGCYTAHLLFHMQSPPPLSLSLSHPPTNTDYVTAINLIASTSAESAMMFFHLSKTFTAPIV